MSGLDPWLEAQLAAMVGRWGLGPDAARELRALVEGLTDTSLFTLASEGPSPAALPSSSPAADRYEDRGLLGLGGMGEVRRVYDRVLGRTVARKALRADLAHRDDLRHRFDLEIRQTVALAHPGVVPVHDAGTLPDGRPYFTMSEIRGETLRARINRVPLGTAELYLRIQALRDVARVLAHAHAQGTVHRDIKPDNLMIGPFGDVLVVDWGLSRGPASGVPGQSGTTLAGTRGYRPDVGESPVPGPTWDVYALGVTLFETLGGRLDIEGRRGSPPPDAPAPLLDLVERATSGARPDAAEMVRALEAWLSGEADRALADAWTDAAEVALQFAQSEASAAEQRATLAHRLRLATPGTASVEQHRAVWLAEDEAAAAKVRANEALEQALSGLTAALGRTPDHPRARLLLGGFYEREAEQAARRGDQERAKAHEARLERTDRSRHARFRAARAAVSLITEPPAQVTAFRIVERDRRRVEVDPEDWGETPLLAREVAPGGYVLHLHRPGWIPVRYPIQVGRHEHWDGVPPDETSTQPIPLLQPGTVSEGEVYVPAGWFQFGGDPKVAFGTAGARVWVDGFLIDRDPVIWSEMAELLRASQGEPDVFERLVPRIRVGASANTGNPFAAIRDGALVWADRVDPDLPVAGVSFLGAVEAARVRSKIRGQNWRLPWEVEWEKAARGVDARITPWGDHREALYSANRATSNQYARCDAFPADESPYGVRGMAGNIKDFCQDAWRDQGPQVLGGRFVADVGMPGSLRPARGGSCGGRIEDAVATYRAPYPEVAYMALQGFRLVRDLPG